MTHYFGNCDVDADTETDRTHEQWEKEIHPDIKSTEISEIYEEGRLEEFNTHR